MNNADELYKVSKDSNHLKSWHIAAGLGLKLRTYLALSRAGYVVEGQIDRKKLLDAVTTGEIWNAGNVGNKTVLEICQWLTKEPPTISACPQCSKQIEPSWKFCSWCGTKLQN